MRNRLGHSRFDEMKVKKGKTWQMGLRYFEEFVKRNFNEDEHQEINVPCVPPRPRGEEGRGRRRSRVADAITGFPDCPTTRRWGSTRAFWS